jgi:hypothetical protein
MGENSFAFNSITDRNFQKILLLLNSHFSCAICPEKLAFLSLKIRAGAVKNSIYCQIYKITYIN